MLFVSLTALAVDPMITRCYSSFIVPPDQSQPLSLTFSCWVCVSTSTLIDAGSDDSDFDKRLDALKKGKGATPYGKSRQDKATQQSPGAQSQAKKKPGKLPKTYVCL